MSDASALDKRMVFASQIELTVGSLYTPAFFAAASGHVHGPQPFFIAERATREDWEQALRLNGEEPYPHQSPRFYYFVSTD